MNNFISKTYRILLLLTLSLSITNCSDDIIDVGSGGTGSEDYKGDMVLFTVGTTANSISSRADEGNTNGTGTEVGTDIPSGSTTTEGKNYYMADNSRFVCRMYYIAKQGSDKIDVEGGSDFMAWLKVSGNVGNSLYWNRFFEPVSSEVGFGGVDDYGNDFNADAFYWQNRKLHVFLAMTDLNKAKNNDYRYGLEENRLKLTPADMSYKIKAEKETNILEPVGYKIYGDESSTTYKTWEDVKAHVESYDDDDERSTFNQDQAACEISGNDWENVKYEYMYGWSCKYSDSYATKVETTVEDENGNTVKQVIRGPIKYNMYYETFPYTEQLPQDVIAVRNDKDQIVAYKNKYGIYLCNVVYKKGTDGQEITELVQTDEYGNTLYNEDNALYTFYYYEISEEHMALEENTYNVNCYDITRGTGANKKQTIKQQPDICQAITKQEPLGATQASNRVNLYFKHQFSQVQVNLKNSADASVTISANQIKNLELLGVADTAYVCIDLNEEGEINHAPMYKSVKASDYNTEHLNDNPYGTSFEMFDMGEENYAPGYLKSYNCITFGQLQAIRITWSEEGTGIEHKATFRVSDTNLQNLKSGVKYIWNMELRRGTLAVVRTEIVDWIVPTEDLEYNANGTIHD